MKIFNKMIIAFYFKYMGNIYKFHIVKIKLQNTNTIATIILKNGVLIHKITV
jgi:hypothetical protein